MSIQIQTNAEFSPSTQNLRANAGVKTINLFDRFAAAYAGAPYKDVIVDAKTFERYSWCDLEALSARFANVLASRGVKKGDSVLIAVPKSVDAVALYLACLRLGAVLMPADTFEPGAKKGEIDQTKTRIVRIVEDSRPMVLIVDPVLREFLGDIDTRYAEILDMGPAHNGSFMDEARQAADNFATVPVHDDDQVALLYTTGSTGNGKGVIHTKQMLALNAEDLNAAWNITANDRVLHGIPLTHIHGLYVALNTLLLAGGSLVLMPGKFRAKDAMPWLDKVSLFMGVPLMYQSLLDDPEFTPERARRMLAGIRLCIAGSSKVEPELCDEFRNRTGQNLHIRYGMSEIMIAVVQNEGAAARDNVGTILPRYEWRLCDPDTREALAGPGTGVLCVRGPCVTPGYRNQSEFNERMFTDGWFWTGDVQTLNPDGTLAFVARDDFMIKRNSLRIGPDEVTAPFSSVSGIRDKVAFGVSEIELVRRGLRDRARGVGQEIIVAVTLEPGLNGEARNAAAANVMDICNAMERRTRPNSLLIMKQIPLIGIGKPNIKALIKSYEENALPEGTEELKVARYGYAGLGRANWTP